MQTKPIRTEHNKYGRKSRKEEKQNFSNSENICVSETSSFGSYCGFYFPFETHQPLKNQTKLLLLQLASFES